MSNPHPADDWGANFRYTMGGRYGIGRQAKSRRAETTSRRRAFIPVNRTGFRSGMNRRLP
jgi:hypothetical protein